QKEGPWTLIFSNNATSWGSFFYDQSQDALRVTTMPQDAPFHEWLTYEFTDRELDHATCALLWENKMIPFSIRVPDMTQLYVDNMRRQLQNATGFDWQNWSNAANFLLANFLLTNKTNLEEALKWSDNSISMPFVGVENFTTLSTKSQILDAMGKKDEAKVLMEKAINHPTATALQVHFYGRQLLGQGKKEDAMKVFQVNEKQHPTEWVVNVGMARGYSAMGNYKSALKYAKIAYEKAPDPQNKESMKQAVARLEKGEDIN
ncbi:MAG: DUF2911 domain-containing protein, partial [Chitinophagales bacterium]